jgi:sphingomyelin phosphodiesterase
VAQARAHYAAYSVQRTDGLRVITLNTNFCKRHCIPKLKLPDTGCGSGYRYGLSQDMVTMLIVHSANLFNYINLSHPDTSGMLRFLTDELQDAEDKGDRGMSLAVPSSPCCILLTFSTSLDHGPRS